MNLENFANTTYQDEWSRWHDKPCINGKPSSNNGWIYTAYAQVLGMPLDYKKLDECFKLCTNPLTRKIHRRPGKSLPPMSRDEILGMDAFNMISTTILKEVEHWQFCDLPGANSKRWYQINYLGALWCLIKIGVAQTLKNLFYKNSKNVPVWIATTSHRNIVWQDSYQALWPLAFRLMPQDTWYMIRRAGFKTSRIHELYAEWSMRRTVRRGDASGILIVWLKLNMIEPRHPLLKQINIAEVMRSYYGVHHPFTIKAASMQ